MGDYLTTGELIKKLQKAIKDKPELENELIYIDTDGGYEYPINEIFISPNRFNKKLSITIQ